MSATERKSRQDGHQATAHPTAARSPQYMRHGFGSVAFFRCPGSGRLRLCCRARDFVRATPREWLRKWLLYLSVFFFAILCGAACQARQAAPVVVAVHEANSPGQLSKHYVILVSLDGFRYDYAKRYGATHLLDLAARGASAPRGMLPVYPSVTFPNHYSMVTGLYPEHHGIVANTFYEPARKEIYNFRDASKAQDGTWYGGTPLWNLAEMQGMLAACFFWPGSEAAIEGMRPAYYARYDAAFPNVKRVDQVLDWLRLPPPQRPHFITLYFSDTDTAGHAYGPDSPQVAGAVREVDGEIGRLTAGLAKLNLPVDVIVVSDHGMANVEGGAIDLDQYGLDFAWLEKFVGGALYAKSETDAQKAYLALRGKSDKFVVYRRRDMPARLHDNSNPRSGDPIVVATGPYEIRLGTGLSTTEELVERGNHGYDPARVPDMKAIFYAAGPDIRRGVSLPSFENVDLYPLIAKILSLDTSHLSTGPIDGRLGALRAALVSSK